jgi:hypothetical protein
MSDPGHSSNCLNCGTPLTGQYCGHCGQRASSRLISIWELTRDAFGDIFELDSRLWRTLLPLLGKPGKLTRDYLEGRRARYMPPFRMYLVLSLLFFVVAFFDPHDDLAILYEADPVAQSSDSTPQAEAEAADTQQDEDAQDVDELDDSLPDETDELAEDDNEINIRVNGDEIFDDCTIENFDIDDAPRWLQRRFTEERLQAVCTRINAAGGKGLRDAILENIPAALIILLPLMAVVLKLLYPLSRRYYVEHLLFFVHLHAFAFLILILQVLVSRLGGWISFLETPTTLLAVAASFYIPVYLYLAMRRVYGQGRIVTFIKFVPLSLTYLAGFTMVMLGAALIAVFSI